MFERLSFVEKRSLLLSQVLCFVVVCWVAWPALQQPRIEGDDYRYLHAIQQLSIDESGGLAETALVENRWDHLWFLAEDGRGLLTISRGLNTALRAADEAGVPAATIYRDIDTEWQSARVIRRFLDQSAFRARQQSGVVLFGRLRPNTLTALKNWGKSSRAEQIAMAPLSAVLTEDQN